MRKKQTIFVVVVFVSVAVGAFLSTRTFEYEASSKILIKRELSEEVDLYLATRLAEQLSETFKNVIGSKDFMERVINSGFNVDEGYFAQDEELLVGKWRSAVEVRPEGSAGVLNISVFHPDRDRTSEIIQAVDYILKTEHKEYHGFGENIQIKILEEEKPGKYPDRPDLALYIPLSFLAGIALALVYIRVFPDEKYDLYLWRPRRTKSERVAAKDEPAGKAEVGEGESAVDITGAQEIVSAKNGEEIEKEGDMDNIF